MINRKEIVSGVVTIFIICFFLATNANARPVPDTGQTKCYNNTVEISCPAPGEAFYGQDSNYTINSPSYTKLDSSGNPLPDDAVSWVMVRDNITGLIWEVKQDWDSVEDYTNPHDVDNWYTWYDSNPATNGGIAGRPGDGINLFDTEQFINALNADHYGGYSDWRLPTINELDSIVNKSIKSFGPTVFSAYFLYTVSSLYWSSTTNADNPGDSWVLDFGNGTDEFYGKSNGGWVRAVRGGQSGSLDHLVINGDGTATDTETGLMWQQATAPGTYTWQQALAYCENLDLTNHYDWRLPTIKDLRSLEDYTRYDPAIDLSAFPATLSSFYWSSTTYANRTDTAQVIDFSHGSDNGSNKVSSKYVRAVRGGQSMSLSHLVISSPRQASSWIISEIMPIIWETQSLNSNVKISLSRQGGLDGSFETIVDTTPNDGQYDWTITLSASVNCVIKIEQVDNSSNWATEGLFVIQAKQYDLDDDGDVDIIDIMMVAARWNTQAGDPNYDAACDLDDDGDIDIVDIMLVAAQWGWVA